MKEKGVAEAKGTARSGRSIFSIRWIVSGGAAALIAVTVLAIGGYAERDSRQKLTHELKTRLVLHARNIALTSAGALLSEFPELTLQPILSEMQVENPEFTLAIVVDHEGIIRGHPQTRRLGTVFEPPSDLQREPDLPGLLPGETFDAGETMFVATVPVLHVTGERIGSAIVGSRRDPIDNAITEARKRMTKLVAVLLGVAIALALAHGAPAAPGERPAQRARTDRRRRSRDPGRAAQSHRVRPAGRYGEPNDCEPATGARGDARKGTDGA